MYEIVDLRSSWEERERIQLLGGEKNNNKAPVLSTSTPGSEWKDTGPLRCEESLLCRAAERGEQTQTQQTR